MDNMQLYIVHSILHTVFYENWNLKKIENSEVKNFDQAEEYNLAKLNSHVIKDVKYKQWRIKYKK